jgi:hypothetical protein
MIIIPGQITYKVCNICGLTLELDCFNKANKICKDGKRGDCKRCQSKTFKKYYAVHKKELNKRHRKYRKKYDKTEHGKEVRNYHAAINRNIHPDRVSARAAVFTAIKDGRLLKPRCCQHCNERKPLEAHHYISYQEKNWLDVIFLCIPCHKDEHTYLKSIGAEIE